jgi:LCP family protein required for cell wall assembly
MREPGWGPVAGGGAGRRWPRLVAWTLAAALTAGVTGTVASAAFVVAAVERERDTVVIEELAEPPEPTSPLNILLVGSDARDGLTAEEQAELVLGEFEGQRADTNILVSISADRSVISLVSVPRDLVVSDPNGGIAKISETYLVGRDALVRAITQDVGFPVNHYVEISITGFMNTVEAVGGIELCLEERLVDAKSGADFQPGCQELGPQEALAYVRSRSGALGDFERIERQQEFLRALARRIVDGSLLLNPVRLRAVGDEVARNVITDDGLGVDVALSLAPDLQRLVTGGLPMVTMPAYPQDLVDIDGTTSNYVIAYQPGLDALVADVAAGRELPSRGTVEQRDETRVRLWHGGRFPAADIVASTLLYGGFRPSGSIAGELDGGATTTVYTLPGHEEQAGFVAAHLGATVRPLPVGLAPAVGEDDGHDVIVVLGDDALPADPSRAVAVDTP